MDLAAELRGILTRYVRGDLPLSDVRSWLARHAHAVGQDDEPALDDLEGLAWLLIAELDYGHRSEDSVRRRLRAALLPTAPGGLGESAAIHGRSQP